MKLRCHNLKTFNRQENRSHRRRHQQSPAHPLVVPEKWQHHRFRMMKGDDESCDEFSDFKHDGIDLHWSTGDRYLMSLRDTISFSARRGCEPIS